VVRIARTISYVLPDSDIQCSIVLCLLQQIQKLPDVCAAVHAGSATFEHYASAAAILATVNGTASDPSSIRVLHTVHSDWQNHHHWHKATSSVNLGAIKTDYFYSLFLYILHFSVI
jgi:hypothetical protein